MRPPRSVPPSRPALVVVAAVAVVTLVGSAAGTAAAAPVSPAAPPYVLSTAPVAEGPNDVTVADVTGDGLLDVVAAAGEARFVTVLPGRGDGSVGVGRNWPISDAGTEVRSGDVDGDGRADLVVLHFGASQQPAVDVLLGDGRGRFAPAVVTYAFNFGTMAVGDVDADGRTDVLIGDGLAKGVRVLFGRADGGLDTGALVPTTTFATSVALADLDADGDLDAVATDANSGTAAVLLGDGSRGFGAPAYSPAGTSPVRLEVGDVDADGDLDVVTLDRGRDYPPVAPAGIVSLRNDGSGALGAPVTTGLPKQALSDLALGDLDGDGRLDAVVPAGLSGGYAALLRGDGAGGFPRRGVLAFGGAPTFACCPFSVDLGDLDRDGRLDLAISDRTADRVTLAIRVG